MNWRLLTTSTGVVYMDHVDVRFHTLRKGARAFTLFKGVIVEKIDIVIDVKFISCNGSMIVVHVMYSAC